jgi:hypothetical protein
MSQTTNLNVSKNFAQEGYTFLCCCECVQVHLARFNPGINEELDAVSELELFEFLNTEAIALLAVRYECGVRVYWGIVRE